MLYGCNVARWSHPRKQVLDALDDAAAAGLKIIPAAPRAHRWGRVECPSCGEHLSVWSTPRNADDHAKDIRRFIRHHQRANAQEGCAGRGSRLS